MPTKNSFEVLQQYGSREPTSVEPTSTNTTVIIGDSMIKRVQGWKIARKVGHRVVVKAFPGATSSEMDHYLKPALAKDAQRVILHVGTNDVFKQGDRADLDKYRPISIIPVVANVFERIIYDQLYAYLMANNLLSIHQSGFRSLHCTVTSLLEATGDWAFNIDQVNVNAVVFLDLKKAFDTVDHNILISKLSACGIRGTSIEWFKSYLSECNQKCFLKGSLSSNRV